MLGATSQAETLAQENERLQGAIVGQGERHRLRAEHFAAALRRTAYSPAARTALDAAAKFSRTHGDLLLVAPSGVDAVPWAAHAHLEGPRSGGPFVVADATQPAQQDGARWADDERSPLTQAAGGTLVLLEPSALPTEARTEINRVLNRRAESEDSVLPGPRLILVSHEALSELASKPWLPPWFLHTLETATIGLPALADRGEDLRALILDVLSRQSLRLGREPLGVDNGALRLLVDHSWPANEVELEALLVRLAGQAQGEAVSVADLAAVGFMPDPTPAPEHTPVPNIIRRRVARRGR
jgi:DNA-binding NtrC family response regulator